MLNGVLPLGDIRNVEKACDRIVEQALANRRARLSAGEREELVAYLIGEAWVLWRRYDPARGAKFSTFAYPQLRMRVLDWWKKKLGRGKGPGEWGVSSLEILGDGELEWALGGSGGDDPQNRVASLDGIFRPRGGEDGRLVAVGGGGADGRAARRAARAGKRDRTEPPSMSEFELHA